MAILPGGKRLGCRRQRPPGTAKSRVGALLRRTQHDCCRNHKANLKKEQTNTNKFTIDDDIKLFKEMTVCAKCGKKVTRRTDSRFAEPVSWRCPECGWAVRLSDESFKAQVINIMNTLIANPDTIAPESPSPEVHTMEGKRLLNEFHRALDSGKANEGELIKMVCTPDRAYDRGRRK